MGRVEEVGFAAEGSHVYGQWHAPAKVRCAAVLLHGFNSSLVELGDLPRTLAENGVAALAIDLRGHGLSGGERGRIDLDRALADVEAAVGWIRARHARVPLALVGHSLGGALGLGIAARRDHFDALVVAHPPERLFDEAAAWERGLYHVMGRVGMRRLARGRPAGYLPWRLPYASAYQDRAAMRSAKAEGYLQPLVNVGNYTFATTMSASRWAAQVRLPTLCIHSTHDGTVVPAHSQQVFDALRGPTEHLVHQGGHSCFRDLDRARVAGGIVEFLRRRLGCA